MDFTLNTILEQVKTSSDMNALQKMALRDALKIGRKLAVKQFENIPEEQLVNTFKLTAGIASELARRIDEWDGTQPELMAGEMIRGLTESTTPVTGGDNRGTWDE